MQCPVHLWIPSSADLTAASEPASRAKPEHIKSKSPHSAHRAKSTEATQSHSVVLKSMWAEQFIPLLLLGTSPVGNSRSEYWWSVCVWRGTPLRSAASPYYCYSKCRNPCLSCRLAVLNQYSPGTDLTDSLSNNIFLLLFLPFNLSEGWKLYVCNNLDSISLESKISALCPYLMHKVLFGIYVHVSG